MIFIFWRQNSEKKSVCPRIFWIRNIYCCRNFFLEKFLSFFISEYQHFWGEEKLPCKLLPNARLFIPLRSDRFFKKVTRMRGMIRNEYKVNLKFFSYFCLPTDRISAFLEVKKLGGEGGEGVCIGFFHIKDITQSSQNWLRICPS